MKRGSETHKSLSKVKKEDGENINFCSDACCKKNGFSTTDSAAAQLCWKTLPN